MISSMTYTLDTVLPNRWSTTQENAIRRDYPFADLSAEGADQYVIRVYLQFLWLPESIMPLALFVPSLLRIASAAPSTSSQEAHPLHALLEPLLLTTRLSAAKYHTELPQILAQGGGGGEQEETMMWYAYGYEKTDDVVDDDEIQRRWLERLERREAQLQILLHMLKLSLPGPCPEPTVSPPSSEKKPKKRKRTVPAPTPAPPSTEDRLESFMDKLSTWQLLAAVASETHANANEHTHDWQQRFCEDVVAPEFKTKLPDTCALFHSKVFPASPFKDPDERSSSPGTDIDEPTRKPRAPSKDPPTRAIARSLSATLAQEKEKASERRPRRAFSREVSMSRVFKERARDSPAPVEALGALVRAEKKARGEEERRRVEAGARSGTTLVASTPVKAARGVDVFGAPEGLRKGEVGGVGVGEEDGSSDDEMLLGEVVGEGVLVAATPTKPKAARRAMGQ